jgi:hypothetical protein
VSITSSKDTVCAKSAVTLNIIGGTTYTWQPGLETTASITFAPSGGSQVVSFIVNGTDLNGCDMSASKTLLVEKCLGIASNDFSNMISVYPNPTNGRLFIDLPAGGNKSLTIMSSAGALLHTQSISGDSAQLDMQDYSRGIYFLVVKSEDKTARFKVVLD